LGSADLHLLSPQPDTNLQDNGYGANALHNVPVHATVFAGRLS